MTSDDDETRDGHKVPRGCTICAQGCESTAGAVIDDAADESVGDATGCGRGRPPSAGHNGPGEAGGCLASAQTSARSREMQLDMEGVADEASAT